MDLRSYYQKIQAVESTISGAYAVVVSCETGDGGKSGVLVEVTRHAAATMVVEGTAQLATPAQSIAFQQKNAAAQKAALAAAASAKLEVTMVSSDDLKKLTDDVSKLKSGSKAAKD